MEAFNLANSSSTNKRRELDFYPTPANVTHALLDFLKLPTDTIIWEPACGDGAMAEAMIEYGYGVQSSDLRNTGYGDSNIDFLCSIKDYRSDVDAIITNPPFALSEQFIIHALKQVPTVAMLLKSQYWHAAKRMPLFLEHPPAWVLALTWRPDFMGGERGGAPTMEVLWTVWIKGQTDTRYRLLVRGV